MAANSSAPPSSSSSAPSPSSASSALQPPSSSSVKPAATEWIAPFRALLEAAHQYLLCAHASHFTAAAAADPSTSATAVFESVASASAIEVLLCGAVSSAQKSNSAKEPTPSNISALKAVGQWCVEYITQRRAKAAPTPTPAPTSTSASASTPSPAPTTKSDQRQELLQWEAGLSGATPIGAADVYWAALVFVARGMYGLCDPHTHKANE